jgi:hypothetical protein
LSAPRVNKHSVVHRFFIGISYHKHHEFATNNHLTQKGGGSFDELELQKSDEMGGDVKSSKSMNKVNDDNDNDDNSSSSSSKDDNDSSKDELYKPVMSEALAYGDIGLIHLEDHYLSTPKKVIALFKWGVEDCGAYYVLRSNDDVYIRIDETLSLLQHQPPSNIMMGLFISGDKMHVPRPETYQMTQEELYIKHKVWTFTLSDYPSNRFPNFLQGNGLLLSRDFASEIANKAYEPRFRLMADDIMIALILSRYFETANKLMVKVDYEFEGLYTRCSDESMWHFNIHPEHMYDLYHNELLKRRKCDGISRFCCG